MNYHLTCDYSSVLSFFLSGHMQSFLCFVHHITLCLVAGTIFFLKNGKGMMFDIHSTGITYSTDSFSNLGKKSLACSTLLNDTNQRGFRIYTHKAYWKK